MHEIIVTPSSQVDSSLPHYIYENYSEFVNFMTKAAESEERLGFGQDILQNLQKYRNFDAYKNEIVQFQSLKVTISAEDDELSLEDGYGFPENNGVLLIGDEVILYQTKEGNTFYGLERGAAGTKVLPTFRSTGEYVKTVAAEHAAGSQVTNLSVLFLVAMLDTIHKSYTPNIESVRISPEINRSSLLQNIKDFFASKGSKLGIQALFKMFFAQNDVDVSYPGDQMIVPSNSTWYESVVMRTVPVPQTFCDPLVEYGTPAGIIGAEITYKSFADEKVYARTMCDYVSAYPYESEVQYELSIDADNLNGDLFSNPKTELTRTLQIVGGNDDRKDVYTVTVASTIGFPDAGLIFIDNECIRYTAKTANQFLNCTRGYIGVEALHASGTHVYGPYYIEASYEKDGITYVSRSFPLGLVESIDVVDPGTLHTIEDEVFVSGSGREEKRDLAFSSFLENTADELAQQDVAEPNLAYISNYTAGPSGVFLGEDTVVVATSSLPYYSIGPFSTDNSVGPALDGHNDFFIIPRRHIQTPNLTNLIKGSGKIGVFADGCAAISNESENRVFNGSIYEFVVEKSGVNYANPTVLFDGSPRFGFSPIVQNGRITGISGEGTGIFTSEPEVTITSGQGAQFSLTFDRFGRILTVTVVNGGQYYIDSPVLSVVDASNRGKGAVLVPTVSGGAVTSVNIVGSGIDYNPATTTVETVTVGAGAVVKAKVEFFIKDAIREINDNPATMLDEGNGFLFDDGTRFGYLGAPSELLTKMGDDGTEHSPIIGYAFDGNPIYGPYGWTNGKDSSEGIQRAYSGWRLRSDREGVFANGNTYPATNPPSVSEYPMGTFIEDYEFVGEGASFSLGRINSEVPEQLRAENGDYLNAQIVPGFILDVNNGRKCNTPDFPAELYPDGVYCYFVSAIGNTPYFPYIIGQTFNNQPLDQDDASVAFNPNDPHFHRNRASGLPTSGDEVAVEIETITSGSISEIVIEDGSPDTTVVGDILRYDSTGTKGAGAEGKVTHVTGVDIENSFGQEITTKLLSHQQRINLRFNSNQSYTFSVGYRFVTTSGAEAVVDKYDQTLMLLDVTVVTPNLIRFGDTFEDQKGRQITIPSSEDGNDGINLDTISGGSNTFISYGQPGDGAQQGDLWWSAETGRLYIYFVDTDSAQWVPTTPAGIRPLEGALDITTGQPGPVTPGVSVPQAENLVTISNLAPSERSNGSANVAGDLWWSPHSGMLYIWNSDRTTDYEQGEQKWSGEWVAATPTGMTPMEGASDYSNFINTTTDPLVYEASVTVIVSEASPNTRPDGSELTPGVLWWSPVSGRMYIYFQDADSTQWVPTDPTGTLSSSYGNNNIIIGDGGTFPDFISILPVSSEVTDLWFESLKYFEVGDTIEFQVGAPGATGLVEQAIIEERTGVHRVTVIRGTNGVFLELPHGTKTVNKTRGLYTVDTAVPHGLRNGDEVIISGSQYDEVNGEQILENAGVVRPAQGVATVVDGEVTGVTITDPGKFYQRNFYVTFVGGGGLGALGFATVADLVDGGGVTDIAMIEGGSGYTSAPRVIFGDETPNTRFTFFTKEPNGADYGVSYITDTNAIRNTAARIAVTSPGVGYEAMPAAVGLLKKQGDRAQTKISLSGQSIESVEVINGGIRYVNPVAVFYDSTGSGNGASAEVTVLDGIVQAVDITRGGSGYVEPYVELIEADGKFITKTETIGQIKSLKVINPGRNLTQDTTLCPELDVETRLVLSQPTGTFRNGQLVYQGTANNQLANATVSGWDAETQILTVVRISGTIVAGETIQNIFDGSGLVIQSGQAEVDIHPSGASQPDGSFIDSTSMPSSEFAVIQDSFYYQRFSYNIASPMQQVAFQDFVQDIVHPSGFKMFSDFRFTESVKSPSSAVDVSFNSEEDYSIYELLITESSTTNKLNSDDNVDFVWTQNSEYITLN